MNQMRALTWAGFCLLAGSILRADTYPVIIQGTVTMEDGSPPPFIVSVERICSDSQGSAPGPLTNKKGEWLWRLEIDAFATRACFFRASHPGYVSTQQDASNLNVTSHATQMKIPPLVLTPTLADPSTIRITDTNLPGKAKPFVEKATKAMDAQNVPEAGTQLQAAVQAAPKFAQGWHGLGVVEGMLQKPAEARDAFQHAVDADPKLLPAWVMLARTCIKLKDWQCASSAADSEIKADPKKTYIEIYLHRAVAQYELKDLAAAETSAQEMLRLDSRHKLPRTEYVLGRILEAKGDANGAREHMAKYVELDPNASDMVQIKAHMENIGKPPIAEAEPELESF
jgi:tetratricopeptide (TPR) repeat protein